MSLVDKDFSYHSKRQCFPYLTLKTFVMVTIGYVKTLSKIAQNRIRFVDFFLSRHLLHGHIIYELLSAKIMIDDPLY